MAKPKRLSKRLSKRLTKRKQQQKRRKTRSQRGGDLVPNYVILEGEQCNIFPKEYEPGKKKCLTVNTGKIYKQTLPYDNRKENWEPVVKRD